MVRRVIAETGVDDWYLVDLRQPVSWDQREYSSLLIRSRWQGHALGGGEPTSVFILLVADANNVPSGPIDPHQFIHVAWGMASRLTLLD